MTVVGLDASSTCTGWSVFKDKKLIDYGAVRPKGDNWRDRLFHEKIELINIFTKYLPDKIIMEDVPQNPAGGFKTAIILGGVQGFIYGIAASYNIPIDFVLPTTWRSKGGLFDGTEKGKKRENLKKKAIDMANKQFDINLQWNGPHSIKTEDDIAEAILIAATMLGIVSKNRKFGN